MARGEPYPGATIGDRESWPMLYPLLISRAELLLALAENDAIWEEEETTK